MAALIAKSSSSLGFPDVTVNFITVEYFRVYAQAMYRAWSLKYGMPW
jgi:hypothetical protein